MPTYNYMCKSCKKEFEVFHLMSETLTDCDACGEKNVLNKVPSLTLKSIKSEDLKEKKVGSVVKSHIDEAKKDILNEKEKLKNREAK